MKKLLAMVPLLAVGQGANVSLEWDHTPYPANLLAGYTLQWGVNGGLRTNLVDVPYTNRWTLTNLSGVVNVVCLARGTNGLRSEPSNAVIVDTEKPSAPANLRVTIIVDVEVRTK